MDNVPLPFTDQSRELIIRWGLENTVEWNGFRLDGRDI
jgi:hypothetical protein